MIVRVRVAAFAALTVSVLCQPARAQLVTRLHHDVVASRLVVSPATLYVPKSIPGSLKVELSSTEAEVGRLGVGTHVEGVLRGPAFPAHRLLGLPNEPLLLPPLPVVGEYRIDDLRLVDTASGETLLEGEPSSIVVHVFPEILVSQVESRPLSLAEIEERGIVIDETRFSAYEFEIAFTVDGQRLTVDFPVVRPAFLFATEIIPAAELAGRRVEADRINRELADRLVLPPQLKVPGLDVQVMPVNFQEVGMAEGDPPRTIPLPSIMVIPGNIGFLNQFFSVQLYTANAAPAGSGLSVHGLDAELVLPSGRDQVLNTADDPLALAESVSNATVMGRLAVRGVGLDGVTGTGDDLDRLEPGQTGLAEFLVEGRREGLHTIDVRLRGRMDGLAAGELPIEGQAVGSVLVRNPRFSIAFTHPETIRTGDPYTASVTILNTSETVANLVSVNLRAASIVGAELAPGQPDSVLLGTIDSGESRTAEFRLIARQTGKIGFGNITGDDGLTGGRFDLTMGIGERGVTLSGQSIVYPEWVDAFPDSIRRATDRVLGQALSVATAAILPPGVRRIERDLVEQRAQELAEAGQRLRYGDAAERVYLDLLADWVGGRSSSLGFDQILRETNAGTEWRQALAEVLPTSSPRQLLLSRAQDLTNRGETWILAATDSPSVTAELMANGRTSNAIAFELTETSALPLAGGWLAAAKGPANRNGLELSFSVPAGGAATQANYLVTGAAGTATLYALSLPASGSNRVCYRVLPNSSPTEVIVDQFCDHTFDDLLNASESSVVESAPVVLSAAQDLSVRTGRPRGFCDGPTFERFGRVRPYHNYGTLVAVLFSKPMGVASLRTPGVFRLENGVGVSGVTSQRGGRVALVNLSGGVGAFIPRQLVVEGATDLRGNPLTTTSVPIEMHADQGVSIAGRVLGADGNPAADLPITLTMTDRISGPLSTQDDLNDFLGSLAIANESSGGAQCDVSIDRRIAQVRSDAEGRFRFDYVMAGLSYRLSATDTRGLSEQEVEFVLEGSRAGQSVLALLEQLVAQYERMAAQGAASFFGGLGPAATIAAAEGVDRAVFDDLVSLGSPRIASEVPVALRFRGRGRVVGTVYLSDGVTAVRNAAVNLVPDLSSREKPRGVFTEDDGTFRFEGVPLGPLTIEAATEAGLRRTIAARLERAGQDLELVVILSETPTPVGRVEGFVFEADGQTGVPGALVQASFGNVSLPHVVSDGTGAYVIDGVPYTGVGDISLVAVGFGGRFVRRSGLTVVPDGLIHANLLLPGRSEVEGRVEFADGSAAAGATVAGGEVLVTTDANGAFLLTGVPVGLRQIAAGIAGPEVPRFGAVDVGVLPGSRAAVTIRLDAVGRIAGTVRNAQGAVLPNVRVAIAAGGGFYWTQADGLGRYEFGRLPLGSYTVVAPAPPVTGEGFGEAFTDNFLTVGGDAAAQVQLAVADVQGLFASPPSVTDPPAGAFGFTEARIAFDGQTVAADIQYLPQGSISGVVHNHLGSPLSADVDLVALKLGPNANPRLGRVGQLRSDAANGAFSFSNINPGNFVLDARSPFYPAPARILGTLSPSQNASGIVLQFSPQQLGRLTGTVLRDGTPVGAGAVVRINVAPGYQLLTDANGRFDTQVDIASGQYRVEVLDPSTGREGSVQAIVNPGGVSDVTVELLRADGALQVEVRESDGAPAAGVTVNLLRGGFPARSYSVVTSASGAALLGSLVEGPYSGTACATRGQLRLCSSGAVEVTSAQQATLTLTLAQRGIIRGVYVESDGATPVGFAQIELVHGSLGRIGFVPTDAVGAFEIEGIPLGTTVLTARNPVTGRSARETARINYAEEVVQLTLREDDLGQVVGRVIGGDGLSTVQAATVRLQATNPLFPPVALTAGPGGDYSFPSVPPGIFTLEATNPVDQEVGSAAGEMPSPVTTVNQDVELTRRVSVPVRVLEANGALVSNAEVRIGGVLALTDVSGEALLTQVPLGPQVIRVRSTTPGRTRSAAVQSATFTSPGRAQLITVSLPGVGSVSGIVRRQDNSLAIGAQVRVRMTDPILGTAEVETLSGANGSFSLADVGVGPLVVEARLGPLAGTTSGAVAGNGGAPSIDVTLSASAVVFGRLVRADGTTIVSGANLGIEYDPPSGFSGAAQVVTSSVGTFRFGVVPEGAFTVSGYVPSLAGAVYEMGTVPAGVSEVDLGDLVLDEAPPEVVEVLPANGSIGVETTSAIEVTFSEPMDPGFDSEAAAYLTDGISRVPLSLSWPIAGVEHRVLVLTPDAPLASQTTYSLVILGPRGSTGVLIDGPVDLAQRPLAASFVSSFTTRDAIPPTIDSFTPLADQQQVSVDAVVRVAFSEVMAATPVLTLTGPSGSIAGTTSLILNGRVAVFTPSSPLATTTTYTIALTQAEDLAGNAVAQLPVVHSFRTIDTLGPVVTDLTIQDELPLLQGTTVVFVASLAAAEANVQIQVTEDLQTIRTSTVGELAVAWALQNTGPLRLYARGVDVYGNQGPWYQENFVVNANLPPQLTLVQVLPVSGPPLTGQPYAFRAEVIDDAPVRRVAARLTGALTQSRAEPGVPSLLLSGAVPASMPGGQSLTVTAEAEDSAGVVVIATPLMLTIQDGVPPAVTLSSPMTAVPGEVVTVTASANDATGVVDLTLETSGALLSSQGGAVSPPALNPQQAFQFTVPVSAVGGSTIQVVATAADAAGGIGTAQASISVSDVVAPTVVSVSPPDGATQVSRSSFVEVVFSEPVSGVSTSSFVLRTGGVTVPSVVLHSYGSATARLVPTGGLQVSTTYEVGLTAAIQDLTQQALVPVTFSFTTEALADPGPQLVSVAPANNATNVALRPYLTYLFADPVRSDSVTAATMILEAVDDGVQVATIASVVSNGLEVRFQPAALRPGTTYTARLLGTITDAAGRAVVDELGRPFAEYGTSFTTAEIEVVMDGGDRVVERVANRATLIAESGAPVAAARWLVDGLEVGTTSGPSPTRLLAAPSLAERPTGTMTVGALATVNGVGTVDVPTVEVILEPYDGDFDQDGLGNGAEALAGLDPWTNDAGDDPDEDGLNNSQELAIGTNPFDPDTDSDRTSDGADPEPLRGNRPPAIGVSVGGPSFRSGVNGSQSYGLGFPGEVRLQAPFTWELWVYALSAASTTQPIIRSGDGAFAITHQGPVNAKSFGFTLGTTSSGVHWTAPFTSPAGWHYLAAVYDGTTFRGYVDGLLAASGSIGGDLLYLPTAETRTSTAFNGYIDDLRLWNIARTASELALNAHRPPSPDAAGLFAYWPFDDMPTSALDGSGNGRHGTLTTFRASGTAADLFIGPRYVLAASQQAVAIAFEDLDDTVPSWAISRLPEHGQLYFGSGNQLAGPLVSAPVAGPSSSALTYTVEPGYIGLDSFEVTVSDGAASGLPATIEFEVPPSKIWTGASFVAPLAWADAANWSPLGAPTTIDRVEIPAGSSGPIILNQNTDIAGLTIGEGRVVDIGANTLTVSGHITSNEGAVVGTGLVDFTGVNAVVHGQFPSVRVSGIVRLTGDLGVAGSLTIADWASVYVGAHRVSLTGDLVANGRLAMVDPLAVVDVDGDATFRGRVYDANLDRFSAGTLFVAGDFSTIGGNGTSFPGTASHLVVLDGTAPQTVAFQSPSLVSEAFQDLTIRNTTGISFQTNVYVRGQLILEAGATIGAGGVVSTGSLVLETGSSLTTSGRLEATSGVQMGADAVVQAGTLSLPPVMVVDPSAQLQSASMEVSSALPPGATFTNLTVSGDLTLEQDLVVPGLLTLASNSTLRPGPWSAMVGGDLRVNGRIMMDQSTALVAVTGLATFGWSSIPTVTGSCTRSTLTNGRLQLADGLDIRGDCYRASGPFRTVLDTAGSVVVDIDYASGSSQNTVGNLELLGGTFALSNNQLYISGDLLITGTVNGGTRDLTIAGTTTFGTGAVVTLDEFYPNGGLSLGSGSALAANTARVTTLSQGLGTLSATNLQLGNVAGIPAGFTFTNLEVRGTTAMGRDIAVPGNLTIPWQTPNFGALEVGAYTLTVAGNFTLNGRLVMASPLGVVDVGGNFLGTGTNGCTGQADRLPTALTAGELRVAGNFDIGCNSTAFIPSPAHRLVLDGALPQTLRFSEPADVASAVSGGYVGTLVVRNTSGVTVTGTRLLMSGDLVLEAGALLTAPQLLINGGLASDAGASLLATTVRVNNLVTPDLGDITVGTLTVDGLASTVPEWSFEDLVVATPIALVADHVLPGELTISGSQGGALTLAGRSLNVAGNATLSGPLVMSDPQDLLLVGGNILVNPASCAMSGASTLAAGTISIGGNFVAVNCAGHYAAGLAHRTLFAGSTPQTLSITTAQNRLGQFEVGAGSSLTLLSGIRVEGNALVQGTLTNNAGRTLTVVGTLEQTSAAVINNLGTITVTGACVFDPAGTRTGNAINCP